MQPWLTPNARIHLFLTMQARKKIGEPQLHVTVKRGPS